MFDCLLTKLFLPQFPSFKAQSNLFIFLIYFFFIHHIFQYILFLNSFPKTHKTHPNIYKLKLLPKKCKATNQSDIYSTITKNYFADETSSVALFFGEYKRRRMHWKKTIKTIKAAKSVISTSMVIFPSRAKSPSSFGENTNVAGEGDEKLILVMATFVVCWKAECQDFFEVGNREARALYI